VPVSLDACSSGPAAPAVCRKGCAYCCHRFIAARAPEVAALAGAIHALDSAPLRQVVVETVHRNAARSHASFARHGFQIAPRCALLGDDDACLVYGQRPENCRLRESRSLEACMMSYLSGPGAARGGDAAPDSEYEMSTALSEFLTDEAGCRTRLAAGQPAFRHALVVKAG
jgi:Fe-S-cluster containining protein